MPPDLPLALLHHEEGVGAVGHGEGEAVPERVAAAMVAVADEVLVDVSHGEGAGLEGTLPAAAALQQPVPGWLHHPERDGLHLCPDREGQSWHTTSGPAHSCFPLSPALALALSQGGKARPTQLLVQLVGDSSHCVTTPGTQEQPPALQPCWAMCPLPLCQGRSSKNLWGRILAQAVGCLAAGEAAVR